MPRRLRSEVLDRFAWLGLLAVFLSSLLTLGSVAQAEEKSQVPDWVVYPEKEWLRITPEEAGLDVAKLNARLAKANVRGATWGGVKVGPNDWGAVLARGGYVVQTWGNPKYKQQSASLGKNFTWVLVGLAVEQGLIKPDDPIQNTWTGEGLLDGPHKYLNAGLHKTLTWQHVLTHRGGFVLEGGHWWRTKSGLHSQIPEGVRWTGDPDFDNYAHFAPGAVTRYSSGAYWRLGQALTALWNQDLKRVMDERVLCHLGIPADRWDWLPGKVVHDTKDFYPEVPGYGDYVDPPYEVNGHVVRGGPGWVVMSSEDLARFGLLIATRGVWKGKRLVRAEYLPNLQYGVGIHAFAGDPRNMVSYAKINTQGFPFGGIGEFAFPQELIAGPVRVEREKQGAKTSGNRGEKTSETRKVEVQ